MSTAWSMTSEGFRGRAFEHLARQVPRASVSRPRLLLALRKFSD